MATVAPESFCKDGLWYHSSGGIIPLEAKYIATVILTEFYVDGSWYQFYEGIMPYFAKASATVWP